MNTPDMNQTMHRTLNEQYDSTIENDTFSKKKPWKNYKGFAQRRVS